MVFKKQIGKAGTESSLKTHLWNVNFESKSFIPI